MGWVLLVELDMELVEVQAAPVLLLVYMLVATVPTASCTSSGINSIQEMRFNLTRYLLRLKPVNLNY